MNRTGNLELHVYGRFLLQSRIGRGGYAVVYQALDIETGTEVALKLETMDVCALEREYDNYQALTGQRGIPRVLWYGEDCEYAVMALELLGPSLEDLLNFCGRTLSLKTVLMLTDQLIGRLQQVHSKGLIHQDLKPQNLLMGDGVCGNHVYVVDLGLAWDYRTEPHSERSLPSLPRGDAPGKGAPMIVGTIDFASINALSGVAKFAQEMSRRDDMESLGYVLIYLLRGALPWDDCRAATEAECAELVLKMKRETSIEDLCADLPDAFAAYFEHVRALRFLERPNYARLRQSFRKSFAKEGFEYDNVFDWTELKFLMAMEESEKAEAGEELHS
ncbi:MAG: hypothetical protein M1817_004137 [Caeruleum heppii]|nr:MAG: hypothetical protein M1817_004137 [Caeruleum heppii]